MRFYDSSRVEHIYGIEPFEGLHATLLKAVKKAGLSDVYTVAPCRVGDGAALEAYGIVPSSFDTIVLFQVLCSIPEPKKLIPILQTYLKPGGQMLVFEHVQSKDAFTRVVQSFWTQCGFPHLFEGCHLNRDVCLFLLISDFRLIFRGR